MNANPTGASAPQSDMLSTLKTSFAEHPMPSALIGMGLIWMFAVGSGALPRVSRKSIAEARRPGYGDGDRKGGPWFGDTGEGVSNLMERQPLLLGAIGIAIGAGVAATLPITSVETNLMGEASDAVRQRAGELAREQSSAATQVLENVSTAVVHESEAQGLTKDNLLRQATDFSERAKRVAGGAVDSPKDKLR